MNESVGNIAAKNPIFQFSFKLVVSKFAIPVYAGVILRDRNGTRTHNHLVRKRSLNHLANWPKSLSISLQTKWLCVRVPLQSLNF